LFKLKKERHISEKRINKDVERQDFKPPSNVALLTGPVPASSWRQ